MLKFEKHLDAAEKASSQIKLSAEKAKTLEAYKMEVLTLRVSSTHYLLKKMNLH